MNRNDPDTIINHSYGFLNDMEGSENTIPRRNFQIGTWNERGPISTKERSRINYWEPRIRTVRDVMPPPPPQTEVRRPRQRQDARVIANSSENVNHVPNGHSSPPNIARSQPSTSSKGSSLLKLTNAQIAQLPQKGPSNWPSQNQRSTETPKVNAQMAQSPQKVSMNWSSQSQTKVNTQVPQASQKAARDWNHQAKPTVTPKVNSYIDSQKSSKDWTNHQQTSTEVTKSSNNPNETTKSAARKSEGSFLLQRTNHYLDAAEMLRRRREMADVIMGEDGDEEVLEEANFSYKTVTVDQKSQRISAKPNLPISTSSAPPPPPPPLAPLFSDMPVTPPTPIQQGQWSVADIKNQRLTLKSTEKREGLRRTVTAEPEPLTFREKLNRILQHQVAAQRWSEIKGSQVEHDDAASSAQNSRYKTIKTLSKAAMKDRLEEILVKGPPQRSSFRGVFDTDEENAAKRKEAISNIRSMESKALRQREDDSESERGSYGPPKDEVVNGGGTALNVGGGKDNVSSRQRLLMADVVSTIKFKGKVQEDTSMK